MQMCFQTQRFYILCYCKVMNHSLWQRLKLHDCHMCRWLMAMPKSTHALMLWKALIGIKTLGHIQGMFADELNTFQLGITAAWSGSQVLTFFMLSWVLTTSWNVACPNYYRVIYLRHMIDCTINMWYTMNSRYSDHHLVVPSSLL